MQKINLIIILLYWSAVSSADLVKQCADALTSGDYNQALMLCESQLDQAKKTNKPTQKIHLYLLLVDIHHALGNSQQEDYYLAKAKSDPNFLKDITIQYNWNRKIGQKYYILAEYHLAKSHLDQGLTIAITEQNNEWISKSYNDMGLVENKLRHYKSSLNYFLKSLDLKNQIGDLYKIGTTLNNLGLVHKNLEEFDKSTHYYEQALDSFIEYTHQDQFDKRVAQNISHLYEDLSAIYIQSNQIEKASYYANKIVSSFELKFSVHEKTRALINLAKLQIEKGEYKTAQKTIAKAQHSEDFSVEILYQLASINTKLGNTVTAIKLAKQGLQLAEQKQHSLSLKFQLLLSQLIEDSEPQLALQHLKSYQQLREQFLSKKYNSELKTIQHKIETQQIQHELISEQLKNTQNQSKIRKLTIWVLSASILFLVSIGYLLFYRYKKKQEKDSLLQTIKYHKQQLLTISSEDEKNPPQPTEDLKKQFNQQLVKTFVEAIHIWEKNTNTNRVEFAEKSKLWTVSIDNGSLRTRSLDKYLKLEKLPKNPRWRSVVKSCHFILADPNLLAEDRSCLSLQLEELMGLYKKLSVAS